MRVLPAVPRLSPPAACQITTRPATSPSRPPSTSSSSRMARRRRSTPRPNSISIPLRRRRRGSSPAGEVSLRASSLLTMWLGFAFAQSFMSGLFRKKGRSVEKRLFSRRERDIVFGECVPADFSPPVTSGRSVNGDGLMIHGRGLCLCRFRGEKRRLDGAPGGVPRCCPQELLRYGDRNPGDHHTR